MVCVGFLEGLPEGSRDVLRRLGKARTFAAGATLFSQEGPADEIFEVERGRVKIFRISENGASLVLAYLQKGELAGITAAAGSTAHIAHAAALTPVAVTSWSAVRFRELMAQDPILSEHFSARIAHNTKLLITRMEELTAAGVEERIARTLMRMAFENRHESEGDPAVLIMTQAELADLVQTTVPTVSRLLARWRRAGIVAGARGSVAVRDVCALAAIARMQQ